MNVGRRSVGRWRSVSGCSASDALRQQVGTQDLKIACNCLALDATLLTRNVADFKPVPGLRVENWLH